MFVCSIDATEPSNSLGRLVNDGINEEENCKMKLVPYCNTPHLCLFTTRDIEINTELRYDYGVKDLPWRPGQTKKTGKNYLIRILWFS